MAATNSIKKNNAKILLADGSEINSTGDNISFKELGGMLGHMMEYMTRNRGSSSQIDDPYTEETLIDVAEKKVEECNEGDKKPSSLPIFEGGVTSVPIQVTNASNLIVKATPLQAFPTFKVMTHENAKTKPDAQTFNDKVSKDSIFDKTTSNNIDSGDESDGTIDLVDSVPTKQGEDILNKTVSLSEDEDDDIPESVFDLTIKKIQA